MASLIMASYHSYLFKSQNLFCNASSCDCTISISVLDAAWVHFWESKNSRETKNWQDIWRQTCVIFGQLPNTDHHPLMVGGIWDERCWETCLFNRMYSNIWKNWRAFSIWSQRGGLCLKTSFLTKKLCKSANIYLWCKYYCIYLLNNPRSASHIF